MPIAKVATSIKAILSIIYHHGLIEADTIPPITNLKAIKITNF